MNKYSSPGRGCAQSGAYTDNSGMPDETCSWYINQSDHDKLISYTSAAKSGDESVLMWTNLVDLEKINLNAGEQSVLASLEDDRGFSTQVAISGSYVLAGSLLLNKSDFSVVRCFEENLYSNAHSGHELVNVPVLGGFLYLLGNHRSPLRDLIFIDTNTCSVRELGGGYSRIVALPGAKVYYAIRDSQLVCERVLTGELVWQRPIPLRWSEHTEEKYRITEKVDKAAISCNDNEVMLFISGAGFYRFEASTGELLHHLDTHIDSVGWQGARYFRECDQVLSTPELYYVIHRDKNRTNAVRGFTVSDNRLIFEKNSEGGYESPLFIAGDLIFFREDVLKAFTARDRFSGDLVWRSKDFMPRAYFGIPVANKLFFYGGNGAMICYEWDEPYTSPHKTNLTT